MARKDSVKHARDNVLSKSQRNKLVRDTEGTDQIIVYLMAFGGMRIGEVAHMRSDWVHINDETSKELGVDHIQIPKGKIPCSCVLCERQAYFEHVRRKIEKKKGHTVRLTTKKYRQLQKKFTDKKREGTLPALKVFWSPKTEAGKRIIPFYNEDFKRAVQWWFKTHDKVGNYHGIYKRVKKLGRKYFPDKRFHPHALRATPATIFANEGIEKDTMVDFFGWADPKSAQPYIDRNKKKSINDVMKMGNKL